jgi:transcriptional regulator with XRE-family HTH domain
LKKVRIDVDQLADYVKWKMDEKSLSLRKAAVEAEVSPATLSRILRNGKKRPRPDMDTLTKLIQWAEVPMGKIIEQPVSQGAEKENAESTLEQIQVHLRADKNLSSEAAQAIAQMVKAAYKQFAKQRRG